LRAQLESFAAQTRQPDEIVVSDDGSTDRTLQIVADFAQSAPFPVSIHRNGERKNFSRNFETAIELCRGSIIFLSDQDDVWFPQKIEKVTGVLTTNPAVQIVVCGQIITDADLNDSGVTLQDNLRVFGLAPENIVSGCATALRKQWARLLLPMPGAADALLNTEFVTYDRWINELSTLLGAKMFLDSQLQYFRQHGANTTRSPHHDPAGAHWLSLFRNRVPRPPVDGWRNRIAVLDLYDEWISAHASSLRNLGSDIDAARLAIKRERTHLSARATLVAHRFPTRLMLATKLWCRGGYSQFNGWKSVLNDLARKL
jgi:glycosyltransferase involved in cell wall biosynthesis